jgi:hypothetical protein
VDALQDPPPEAAGYLWFLRVTALVAIPLFGMATVVGPAVEAVVVVIVGLAAASAFVVAARMRPGRLQFAIVGAILAVLTALFVWASLR